MLSNNTINFSIEYNNIPFSGALTQSIHTQNFTTKIDEYNKSYFKFTGAHIDNYYTYYPPIAYIFLGY